MIFGMEWNFFLAEVLGIVVGIFAISAMQMKNMTLILIFQLTANALVAVTYALKNEMSGASICFLAVAQTLAVYFLQRKGKKIPILMTSIFVVLYITCSALTYTKALDLLSATAAVCYALGVAQSKPSVCRLFFLFNGALWTVFDITTNAATTVMLIHGFLTVSGIVGMIRLDRADWKAFFTRVSCRAKKS